MCMSFPSHWSTVTSQPELVLLNSVVPQTWHVARHICRLCAHFHPSVHLPSLLRVTEFPRGSAGSTPLTTGAGMVIAVEP